MVKIRDLIIKKSLWLGFLFLGGQIFTLIFFWTSLPTQLPLFYNHPWGQDQLVKPAFLIILPLASFLVSLLNLIFASLIPEEQILASHLLTIFATVFNLLSLVTLFKIITLVA